MRKQNVVFIPLISVIAILCVCICITPEHTSNADTSTQLLSADITKKPDKTNAINFFKNIADNLSIDKLIANNSVYICKKTTHYNEDGIVDWFQNCSLDNQGNVTKIVRTEPAPSNNEHDDVTTVEIRSNFTDTGYPQKVKVNKKETTYSYTEEDGALIEKAKTGKNNPVITTYEFYPTGVLKSKTEEKQHGDDKKPTTTTTTYDENGYISTHTVTGEDTYSASYTWTFDAANNPIEYYKDIEDSFEDEFYWVENDEHGNIASINRPEDGQVVYEFEYQQILNPSDAAFIDAKTKEI